MRLEPLPRVKQLEKVGFTQSKIDECVFYKGSMIYILYTDDSILAGPNREEIDKTIEANARGGTHRARGRHH